MNDVGARQGDSRRRRVPRWAVVSLTVVGVLVLVFVGTIAGGWWFFRDAINRFEKADGAMEVVAERYGPIPAFRADPLGTIQPERIEAFLAARDAVAEPRGEVEHSLAVLSDSNSGGGVALVGFRKLGAGFGILRDTAGFLTRRNEALLDAGMGLGEYYYIYSMAFYGLQQQSPADGPSFELVGDSGYVLETVFQGTEESVVRAHRSEVTRTSLNGLFLPVLRNQLADLETEYAVGGVGEWQETLAAEITALEADAQRLPWEDGLPQVIEVSLLPYRDRLDASYAPMCNALEVGVARR